MACGRGCSRLVLVVHVRLLLIFDVAVVHLDHAVLIILLHVLDLVSVAALARRVDAKARLLRLQLYFGVLGVDFLGGTHYLSPKLLIS